MILRIILSSFQNSMLCNLGDYIFSRIGLSILERDYIFSFNQVTFHNILLHVNHAYSYCYIKTLK